MRLRIVQQRVARYFFCELDRRPTRFFRVATTSPSEGAVTLSPTIGLLPRAVAVNATNSPKFPGISNVVNTCALGASFISSTLRDCVVHRACGTIRRRGAGADKLANADDRSFGAILIRSRGLRESWILARVHFDAGAGHWRKHGDLTVINAVLIRPVSGVANPAELVIFERLQKKSRLLFWLSATLITGTTINLLRDWPRAAAHRSG